MSKGAAILGFVAGGGAVLLALAAGVSLAPHPAAPVAAAVPQASPLRRDEVYVTFSPELVIGLDAPGMTLRFDMAALVSPGEGASRLIALRDTAGEALRAEVTSAVNDAVSAGPHEREPLIAIVREAVRQALESLPMMPQGSVREILITRFDAQ